MGGENQPDRDSERDASRDPANSDASSRPDALGVTASPDGPTLRLLVKGGGGDAPVVQPVDDLNELRGLVDDSEFVWLDVDQPTPELLSALEQALDLDREAIEDILDVEQLPKVTDFGDHYFVILHALTSDGDRVDTLELDVFLRSDFLLTVHSGLVASVEWLWSSVQLHPLLCDGGANEMFGHLAEVVGRRYFEVAHALEVRVDNLSEPALEAHRAVLAETQVLRREEATLRQMLRPQRLALAELRTLYRTSAGSDAPRYFDDAYDVHNQVVEAFSSARTMLNDTLDIYRGAASERETQATTILAVYSAILLPLSLIAGWYGMNFENLPGASDSRGWIFVTVLMVLIAVASTAVFIRSGMIRAPSRPSRLARRGLASAVRVPTSAVSMLRRPAKQ